MSRSCDHLGNITSVKRSASVSFHYHYLYCNTINIITASVFRNTVSSSRVWPFDPVLVLLDSQTMKPYWNGYIRNRALNLGCKGVFVVDTFRVQFALCFMRLQNLHLVQIETAATQSSEEADSHRDIALFRCVKSNT